MGCRNCCIVGNPPPNWKIKALYFIQHLRDGRRHVGRPRKQKKGYLGSLKNTLTYNKQYELIIVKRHIIIEMLKEKAQQERPEGRGHRVVHQETEETGSVSANSWGDRGQQKQYNRRGLGQETKELRYLEDKIEQYQTKEQQQTRLRTQK